MLFEKQSKDMGLKELPQDGDVDIRGGKEPAATRECAGRGEDVQVRMPVQKLSGCLDREERAGKRICACVVADVGSDAIPCGQGGFWEKGTAIPKGRAKRLGQGEHEVPVVG